LLNKRRGGGEVDNIIVPPNQRKEKKSYFNTLVKTPNYPETQDQTFINRYDEVISTMKESGQIKRIMQTYGIQ